MMVSIELDEMAEQHEELKSLTDEVEVMHAGRLQHLARLAQIRNIDLDDLMLDLGFRSHADA